MRLDEERKALDFESQNQLTDYCEGINDGMRHVGRTFPMWASGFHPGPWDPQAVLLIGSLLSYAGLAVGQQQNERLILELIQAGIDDAQLRELFSPVLDHIDFGLLRQVQFSSRLSDDALKLITDLPRLAGSNAWAVAPSRTISGSAMLASDPHLEINRLPAIWYEAVLKWRDQYVIGATLPGCPLFAVARNRNLAWGVTYMKGDTSDFFIEDCSPGGATGWRIPPRRHVARFRAPHGSHSPQVGPRGIAAHLLQRARLARSRSVSDRTRSVPVNRLDWR